MCSLISRFMKPYVGITGVKTLQDVFAISSSYRKYEYNENVTGMYGFPSSPRKLEDYAKVGKRGPCMNDLAKIVSAVSDEAIPMIHYYTKNFNMLADEIEQVFMLNNLYDVCKAVQLNLPWPKINEVEKIKNKFRNMEIVLQISGWATEGFTLNEISEKVQEYDALVDYCLFDPSMGRGIPFDLEEGIMMMNILSEALPNALMGVAGGFDGNNVGDKLKMIKEGYDADFFIDAEGGLRDNNNELDYEKVDAYLKNAADVLIVKK